MIKQLIFSKGRPLQLDGAVRSGMQYSGISPSDITVIVDHDSGQDFRYIGIEEKHGVNVVAESTQGYGFIDVLSDYVNYLLELQKRSNRKHYIWFGTDDAVYWRKFDLNRILRVIQNEKILGFSLRLGKNIVGYDDICSKIGWLTLKIEDFLIWNPAGFGSHWGYPFDVTNSIYGVDLVKEVLDRFGPRIRIPNDLETYGVQVSQEKQHYLCCYDDWTFGGAVDVNMVQTLYPNKHAGTDDTTPEKLLVLYDHGYRMDIDQYKDIRPCDPFIGKTHGLRLMKKV